MADFDGFGIDGNLKVFEELVKLLKTGEAVGFVGAGASAPLYPLWTGLIDKLAAEAVGTRKADERKRSFWCRKATEKPDKIAKQIRDVLDPGVYTELMRKQFSPMQGDDGRRFTETHARLVGLPFQGFVTTNYDPCLDEACFELRKDRKPVPFTWSDDRVKLWWREDPADDRELPILHAHGRFDDADSQILCVDDYREVYGEAAPYKELLGHLFTRKHLVFLGFGFSDPWVTSFADRVSTLAGIRETLAPRHIAMIGLPEAELDEADLHAVDLEESLRANVLFYPVGPDHDHSALTSLLDELLSGLGEPGEAEPDSVSTKASPPKDLLGEWLSRVVEEHGRLADCFNRPGRLHLIEEAWVELQVQPDQMATDPDRLSERMLEGKASGLLGQRLTLDEALALTPEDAGWITGRWLLEGPPGSGKTTMLRHFARTLAEAADPSRVPLFVSLSRVVGQSEDWLTVATDGFQIAGSGEVVDVLRTAGSQGHLVVLLDGLDEVPPKRRRAVDTLLGVLRRDWPACSLVLSTRPLGRGRIPDGFPRLELLPLTPERQTEFLVKWFEHAGRSPEDALDQARQALACFGEPRGLRELSSIPLYLTLLAILWQGGGRPPERLVLLYDEIFRLLLKGEHREPRRPIAATKLVREVLSYLALSMTEDDCWADSLDSLDDRLRAPEFSDIRSRLETVGRWREDTTQFFNDVYERTHILGPHDGRQEDWRFLHRTFREALTAELLWSQYGAEKLDLDAVVSWARDLPGGPAKEAEDEASGEGRWAEPLALLAGRLEEPDALVSRLAKVKPGLALRSMVFTQGLKPETLIQMLRLAAENPHDRTQVFEKIPDQLGDPVACLALVEQLKAGLPGGFDLYWLGWILDQVQIRWPGYSKLVERAQGSLFDFIPEPDPELFRFVEAGLDGRVPLWTQIPAGEGWIGSPDHEEGRDGDEGPRHRITVEQPFFMSVVTITNRQYAAFDPANAPHKEAGVSEHELPNHPRLMVDWYEAMAFCRWLSACPGFTDVRLPTEEEWEYACRAGTETRYWNGDAESDLVEVDWHNENSGGRTHKVGEMLTNPWGLYDVHGNVWEWTASEWKGDYSNQASGLTVDPTADPARSAGRSPRAGCVIRGGGYWGTARVARSACRGIGDPEGGGRVLGFRVLLPFAPSDP